MSSCALRRWGPGTVCDKPVNNANVREMEKKMADMIAERERQEGFWGPGTDAKPTKSDQLRVSAGQQGPEPKQQIRFWN